MCATVIPIEKSLINRMTASFHMGTDMAQSGSLEIKHILGSLLR